MLLFTAYLTTFLSKYCLCLTSEYIFDYTDGFGRQFDGIGAISGGGVSERRSIYGIIARSRCIKSY